MASEDVRLSFAQIVATAINAAPTLRKILGDLTPTEMLVSSLV